MSAKTGSKKPSAAQPSHAAPQPAVHVPVDVCPVCSESQELALIKGCLRCLRCGYKWDCNGW